MLSAERSGRPDFFSWVFGSMIEFEWITGLRGMFVQAGPLAAALHRVTTSRWRSSMKTAAMPNRMPEHIPPDTTQFVVQIIDERHQSAHNEAFPATSGPRYVLTFLPIALQRVMDGDRDGLSCPRTT